MGQGEPIVMGPLERDILYTGTRDTEELFV